MEKAIEKFSLEVQTAVLAVVVILITTIFTTLLLSQTVRPDTRKRLIQTHHFGFFLNQTAIAFF